MKHLNREWGKIREETRGSRIALFLDFDGTLTPIQDHPDNVFLSTYAKNILEKLAGKSRVSVSVISGRALADVEARVGVKGIMYSGNHGLEVKGPFGRRKLAEAVKAKKIISKVKEVLLAGLERMEGIYLEDKGLTLSMHFRMVREEDIPAVRESFNEAVAPYLFKKEVVVTSGKKVWEVRPPIEWHKGRIVRYIYKKIEGRTGKKITPVYIGDDVTDEDAFREVNEMHGYSVKIVPGGKAKSCARYYLNDTEEVMTFLSELYITERLKGVKKDV